MSPSIVYSPLRQIPEARTLFSMSLLASHLVDGQYLSLATQGEDAFEAPVEWYNLGELVDAPSTVPAWTFLQLRCKITYSEALEDFKIQLERVYIVL